VKTDRQAPPQTETEETRRRRSPDAASLPLTVYFYPFRLCPGRFYEKGFAFCVIWITIRTDFSGFVT
jgi:hypothetical protein